MQLVAKKSKKQWSDPGFNANTRKISPPHTTTEITKGSQLCAQYQESDTFYLVFHSSNYSGLHRDEEIPLCQNCTVLQVITCITCLSGNDIIQSHLSSCDHESLYLKSFILSTDYCDVNLFTVHTFTPLMAMPPANFHCKCIHRRDMPTGSVSTLSLSLKNSFPAIVYLSDPFTETIISLLSFVFPG